MSFGKLEVIVWSSPMYHHHTKFSFAQVLKITSCWRLPKMVICDFLTHFLKLPNPITVWYISTTVPTSKWLRVCSQWQRRRPWPRAGPIKRVWNLLTSVTVWVLVPVSVQYEHHHTIPYNPFLSVLVSVFVSMNAPLFVNTAAACIVVL